jgi:hypothetical protein
LRPHRSIGVPYENKKQPRVKKFPINRVSQARNVQTDITQFFLKLFDLAIKLNHKVRIKSLISEVGL